MTTSKPITTNTTPTTPPKSISKLKSRKQLNELQSELLLILYKFRFGTVDLIAQYQNQSVRYTNVRLKILLEQDFVGRNYDSSYNLKGWAASYYLLPKAINLLKTNPDLDPKGLHLLYYNRKAKPVFVNHWLRMFRFYLKFDELYGRNLEFYTSSELAEQKHFLRPLPDGYMTFSGKHSDIPDCMFELIESSTSLARLRPRITRYMTHHETSNWDGDYPRILLVFDNVGLEQEIQRYIARTLDRKGIIGLDYYTTTIKALLGSDSRNNAIWSDVLEPKKLISLYSLD